MRLFRFTTLILFTFLLSTCASLGDEPTQSLTTLEVQIETPTSLLTPSAPDFTQTLTVWLTPTFAPDRTTPHGELLADRLAAFEQTHPGIRILVRIKAEDGPGGILDALVAANTAAPLALPDIISLDPINLTTATLKGLVIPLDELAVEPKSPDWYDHALSFASASGGFFGQPFGSEAEVLVYATEIFAEAPQTWSALLAVPATFLFPAGDLGAAFTLTQYQNLGGTLHDEDGLPSLDADILADILAIYQAAQTNAVLPSFVIQYRTAKETWAALQAQQASSAVAPLSLFLAETNFETYNAISLPTLASPGICLTDTWSWGIVTQDPIRQNLAAELISWLTLPEFLGPWTHALGFLPPTSAALELWPDGAETSLVSRFVTIAQPRPSIETLATFGPPIHQAVQAVLQNSAPPSTAALEAVNELQNR